MPLANRFNILLACALTATLGIKILVAGGVRNPSFETIAGAMRPFFERNGFDVAGETTYAGRPALLVSRGPCLLYSIPVAQQGWHQAIVRQSMTGEQYLWFATRGAATMNIQPRWAPLIEYYFNKALRYVGIARQYPPVLALVASNNCDIHSLPWNSLPSVPFEPISILEGF